MNNDRLLLFNKRLITGDMLFPDYANVIHDAAGDKSDTQWTAPEDCFVVSSNGNFRINGINTVLSVSGEGSTSAGGTSSVTVYVFFGYVAKGSVLTGLFKAYGLKPSS